MSAIRLNLGCCDTKIPGFTGVDVCQPADFIANLEGPWPWGDSSVEEVIARDVFEHIGPCSHVQPWCCTTCYAGRSMDIEKRFNFPVEGKMFSVPIRHWAAKAHVMNELHRILVPGGRATLQIPHATLGDGGHCDPTHKSFWTTSDFEYYSRGIAERERFRGSAYYGVKADFKVVNLTKPGSLQCVPCKVPNTSGRVGCFGDHIPTLKYPRTFGGYVVEMQIVLECVK